MLSAAMFSKVCSVFSVRMPVEKGTNKLKGYASVELVDSGENLRAICLDFALKWTRQEACEGRLLLIQTMPR